MSMELPNLSYLFQNFSNEDHYDELEARLMTARVCTETNMCNTGDDGLSEIRRQLFDLVEHGNQVGS